MRAAANFLVANHGRQKIISMARAVPKIAIFEEAARTLDIPGGEKMIQEYYRQMREFGCNILAVVQQYDIIKDSPVRGAMIGNSKMCTIVGFIRRLPKGVCARSIQRRFIQRPFECYCRHDGRGGRSKWLQLVIKIRTMGASAVASCQGMMTRRVMWPLLSQ
jgi:hypothetical protein